MSEVEITDDYLRSHFKPRNVNSRKGENGIVGVVGGSRVYHGAPTLASLAAYRAGVDLVYLAVPKAISTAVRALSPSLIVFPLPDGKLTVGSANRLLTWLPPVGALALGPGLGKQKTAGMIRIVEAITSKETGLVLDADALMPEVITKARGKRVVLTPHAGEFARVFGVNLGSSLEERVSEVRKMASEKKVTILLKGRYDVISDGTRIGIDKRGSPAMTVGGTGDVLTGIVAAFLSKGMDPFVAASCAAYVNGVAGEKAAERLGMHIIPTDLIDELPHVLKKFDRVSEGAG